MTTFPASSPVSVGILWAAESVAKNTAAQLSLKFAQVSPPWPGHLSPRQSVYLRAWLVLIPS